MLPKRWRIIKILKKSLKRIRTKYEIFTEILKKKILDVYLDNNFILIE